MLTPIIISTILLLFGVTTNNAQTCSSTQECDVGINNNCYKHVDESVNWFQAESNCIAWGGHLASIHSAGVNHLLNDIRNKDAFTWIGLSDTATNGEYVWTDGTLFDYNNFATGQPDSLGGEGCFHFFNTPRGEITWNDYHCSRKTWGQVRTSYICQKRLRPILDSSRCDVNLNGKCYIFGDTASTWQAAEDSCVQWGGHLASIHSDLENYAVNSIRDNLDFTWIGLSDTARDGEYVWTDGTPFDYNNFAPGQPDSLGGESCFHLYVIYRGELSWNDYHCSFETWGTVQVSFVCKKDYVFTDFARTQTLKGEQGERGLQGVAGPIGFPGIKGDRGDRGYPGSVYYDNNGEYEYNPTENSY